MFEKVIKKKKQTIFIFVDWLIYLSISYFSIGEFIDGLMKCEHLKRWMSPFSAREPEKKTYRDVV